MSSAPLLILMTCIVNSQATEYFTPVVHTPLGEIIGTIGDFYAQNVHVFKGIPYAVPPIDGNRFKKTVPLKKLPSNPFYADRTPSACPQTSGNPFPWLDDMPNQREDCLNLNVFAPRPLESSRHAVMIWVHGGGFRIGSGRLDFYDGEVMAVLGNVIVVTINYRLGPEGFLDFGVEDAPGNMGLYDILEAVKWVKANICYFGGDDNNITLFGQSAGAIAISMLMTSPLAEGLFVRAIMQSGSAANLDAEDNDRNRRLSQAIADAIGCDKSQTTETIACLRDVDALTLAKVIGKVSDNPQRGLYPKYGDEILPMNPREAFLRGNFSNKDVLIGVTSHEGATIITKVYKDVFGFFGHLENTINKTFAEAIIRSNFKTFPNVDAVVTYYLEAANDNDSLLHQVYTASGDYSRLCPSVYLGERIAAKGNRVYFYHFKRRPFHSPFAPWMGAIHGEETPFAFGYPLRNPDSYTWNEILLSRTVLDIWTNFAKTGRQILQPWPLYSKNSKSLYHILDTSYPIDSDVGSGPHPENCNFFRPYFGFS